MSRDHGPGADAYTPAAMVKRLVRVAETDDLIEELRRRGRLRGVSVSQTYYEEMVSDEGYMRVVNGNMAASAAKLVASILVMTERPPSPVELARKMRTRDGVLSVLIQEGA